MIIDFIFVGLMLLAVVNGYRKGFIIAIFSIVALMAGLAAAIKLSALTATYLKESMNVSDKWLPILAFALIFFVVVLLIRLGAKFIEKTAEWAVGGWVNQLGGILLYAFLYATVLSILLYFGSMAGLPGKETTNASITYHHLLPWGPRAVNGLGSLVPVFRDTFHDMEIFFERIAAEHQEAAKS